ncbi:UvrD/REP helicase [Burkholderia pseudomallei]|uniref:UvrD-helicase domain-containing protein n=1 Tax=Burkholderia pseudomallei TaxID=28450 RepID=UPI000F061B0E|nr:UvrD-helicase domain-containing protein [Burkholderia pseudomallei]VBY40112.1 UvrD/REP helicase [Burkholderia pseudomallei]VBY63103.1 UvrD/REP helicase [Burkholderia pseudomallei]VBY77322.1 UvrD/REP helicase [Burkholderia pseudomallei]VBY88120.1 UvrD/REP helicase [Burkholderia pseudomallei]
MTPFHTAREAATQLRHQLFADQALLGVPSNKVIDTVAAENAEDFDISDAEPDDEALGTADAVLIRKFRQIVVRNDVPSGERAFLIAHEFGHWKLHHEGHEGCHKVVDSTLKPEDGDTFGAQKIEAYGARERAELQANIFARELLLPRAVARGLFLAGKTATQLAQDLDLPLELVRQQLLDALLLPEPPENSDEPPQSITPTKDQMAAATSSAKASLVVAGPGTGKTATLLMRVQHLLAEGAKPESLLLLTFSNRAARELVDRLQELGITNAHDIWVGTFHAFGLEFLRKNHEQFGLRPRFGVADKMAQVAILEPHIYGLDLTAFNPLGDPLDWLKDVISTIQRAKDELADAAEFANAVDHSASDISDEALARQYDVVKLYRCYESKMQANGSLVDMGDLVMLPALALTKDFAKYTSSVGRFKHILVDEYQDVNRASAQLVKALAAHAKSLWVVGDARQAIYRFRGASMRNIVRFGDDFPTHATFPLNENRRSFEEIIRVFEHTGREGNPLQMMLPLDDVGSARGHSGIKPRHVQCANDDIVRGELAANVRRIHGLGVAYRDQVILASTHETCSTAADSLNAAGVPALHLGDIFQRPEIKDLLALLQLFIDRSGSGLLRVSRLPGLELPSADAEKLVSWCKANRPAPLSWVAVPPTGLSSKGAAALKLWATVFDGLASADSPWEVACELLLDRTNILRAHLAGSSILDITRRIALWQFIYYLRVPDGGRAYQTVGSFITRLRRRLRVGDDRELRIPPPEADSLDAVAVMTIHGSKGLEFEAVHLVDIDAKHFRMGTDSDLVPQSLLQSIAPIENFEEQSEASNKLYVALSRAREHLVLYETKAMYNAACVAAITGAAHLFERVQGMATVSRGPASPPGSSPVAAPAAYELAGFLSYRVCPRRYYYDFIKELSPAAGLHPAALIEGAVMRELFAPYGEEPGEPPAEVEKVLASLVPSFKDSVPHLRAYADQLLRSGRAWLGTQRAAMAKPFDIECGGIPLHVSPHRITKTNSGSMVKIEFVRVKPSGKLSRQHKTLKWVLKYMAEAYPRYSFQGSIFVLSTATEESVSPYGRLPDDFFLVPIAQALMAGDFEAKPNPWECPKCRHFLHCPA